MYRYGIPQKKIFWRVLHQGKLKHYIQTLMKHLTILVVNFNFMG